MNLLFYSERCEYSKSVLLTLEKEGLIKYFNLISVDNPETQKQIAGRIKYVPSMTLVGCETILTINEIFKWISAQKFMSKNRDNLNPSPINPEINKPTSNIDKVNNLRNKLEAQSKTSTTTVNTTTTKNFTPYDQYSKGVQLTSINHDDPTLSGGTYSNINENTSNAIFTGEELALSSKRHKKLVAEYENSRKLQDIERNMQNKKPKHKLDFAQVKPTETEDLVHVGYYTEIIKDLTKSPR